MPEERLITAEEFAGMANEEGWKDELLDGVVSRHPLPGAAHGVSCARLAALFCEYCDATGFGKASVGSGLIVSRNPDSVLAPDVQLFSALRLPDTVDIWPGVPPRLVVEVVCGVSEYNHAMRRMPYYLAFGIDLIWVVGLRRRLVEVIRLADQPRPFDPWEWRSRGHQRTIAVGDSGTLGGGDVLPGFACKVADLFS